MELKEFTSKLKYVKKIQEAVSKLRVGTCNIESFSDEGITLTVTFNCHKSDEPKRIIGFH